MAQADAPGWTGFPSGTGLVPNSGSATGEGHILASRPTRGEPPGQPGFSIQTCEQEHKEAIYAAAIATLDFSFIPKHELSSQS